MRKPSKLKNNHSKKKHSAVPASGQTKRPCKKISILKRGGEFSKALLFKLVWILRLRLTAKTPTFDIAGFFKGGLSFVYFTVTFLGGVTAYFTLEPQIIIIPPEQNNGPFNSRFFVQNNSVLGIEDISIYFGRYDFIFSNGTTISNSIANNGYALGNIERGEKLPFRIREIVKVNSPPIAGAICVLLDYNYSHLMLNYKEFRGFVLDERSEGIWEKDNTSCDPSTKNKLLKFYTSIQKNSSPDEPL